MTNNFLRVPTQRSPEGFVKLPPAPGDWTIPYATPIDIVVVPATLAKSSGPGIRVRLISSTAGLAGVGVGLRNIFLNACDYDATISDVWSIGTQAASIYSRSGCQHFARLDLVGHGTDDNLGLILGSDIITRESLYRYASVFDGLDQYFDTDSFLWIMGCGMGGNEDILRRIAGMTGVSTWAGIGDVNPGGTSDSGLYVVCDPSGHCVKSHTRPA
jgi:hypothetical protein